MMPVHWIGLFAWTSMILRHCWNAPENDSNSQTKKSNRRQQCNLQPISTTAATTTLPPRHRQQQTQNKTSNKNNNKTSSNNSSNFHHCLHRCSTRMGKPLTWNPPLLVTISTPLLHISMDAASSSIMLIGPLPIYLNSVWNYKTPCHIVLSIHT